MTIKNRLLGTLFATVMFTLMWVPTLTVPVAHAATANLA